MRDAYVTRRHPHWAAPFAYPGAAVPVDLKIRIDSAAIRSSFRALGKQMPYAAAVAVNDLAFQVQRAERAGMEATFAHPRPFTARSAFVTKATKAAPVAVVYVRPEVARYLTPYEDGGLHILPAQNVALMEPKHIGVDAYGQLRKGTTGRLKARRAVFVGTVKTKAGDVYGFWQRLKAKSGPRLKLLIRFAANREVTKQLRFEERARRVVDQGGADAIGRAVVKAIETAFR